MKNLALLVAFALLAIAVPASAAETSEAVPTEAVPAPTLEQLLEGPVVPLELPGPLIPYCSAVNGTSCTTLGAKRSCTDICGSQLTCTCTYAYGNPTDWFWLCQHEC